MYPDGQVRIRQRYVVSSAEFVRIAAMTFGRPMRIPQQVAARAQLPTAEDDEYLAEPGATSQKKPSSLKFFIAYCKLHQILADLLSSFYTYPTDEDFNSGIAQFNARAGTQNLDKLLQFERRMTEWYNTLESHLQISSSHGDGPDASTFERQANILYAR